MSVRPVGGVLRALAPPVGAAALMAVVTFLAAYSALHYFRIPGIGSPIVWPAAGLAVAILTRFPRRWWVALTLAFLVGYLAANHSINSWPVAITYLVTGLVEVLVAAAVLRQRTTHSATPSTGSDGLRTPRDAIRFIIAVTAAISTGAALIVLSSLLFPAERGAFTFIGGYLLAHLLGMLIAAPVLIPRDVAVGRGLSRALEFALVLAIAIGFGVWIHLSPHGELFPYPMVIPVVWAAIRFGAWRSTALIAVVVGIVSFGTARSLGPFAGIQDAQTRDITTQLFLATLAATAIALVVITRHRAELIGRALASEEALAGAIRHSTAGMYSIWLDPARFGLIREVNAAFTEMLGFGHDELVGQHCSMLGAGDDPEARALLDRYLRQLADGSLPGYREESQFTHASGETLWVQTNIGTVRPPGGAPFALVQVHDLTVRERNRAELEYMALHDPLTGLANRTLLFQRMAADLEQGNAALGLLYLDLDGFKDVNDRCGHHAGDTVLVTVARRLTGAARPGDTVARLGGDEFAVLCPAIPDADALVAIAGRMRDLVGGPIKLDGGETVTVDVSIGIGITHGATDVDSLLREADQDMYQTKQAQRTARPF